MRARETIAEPRVPATGGGFLSPFRYRDFRLLWTGLAVGNVGTWMQFTALGYYVAKLAPNAALGSLYIGLLGGSRMIPVLLASPFAGVVADRYPRRRILLWTNALTAVVAVLLSLALYTDTASLWVVIALSGIQAATQSFDAPARQSWVPLMVPREYVGNAIGLNSIAFNAPSVVGPPLAGLLIAAVGVAPCMGLNALLKLWVVAAIVMMSPAPPSSRARNSFGAAFLEGVRFIFGHPVLRWIFVMLIVSALTVRSYNFLLPAYAVHVVLTDARGLGWMMASSGVGAMCGAIATAAMTVQKRSLIWFVSGLIASLGVLALGLTRSLPAALVVLAALGFGTQVFIGASNILVQMLSPDDMRGRTVSVYSMILLGLVPGGAFLVGSIATVIDLRTVFVGAGAVATAVGVWTYLAHPKLRRS